MRPEKHFFYKYLAQTSEAPLALEIESAEGSELTDIYGKTYIDFISGISVSHIGHSHPEVVKAVTMQARKYMHLMVYGEYIQSPQVLLGAKLASLLPPQLNNVYFVNSGAEAIEGAMKLSKRYTGRHEIVSFKNAYHGSTQGALSLMGNEVLKAPFRPLLPGVKQLRFNNLDDLTQISHKTACVIVEVIQGEAGIIEAESVFLEALSEKCREKGVLLVFDEIQTGMGRTGKMFGFNNYTVSPDIVTLAKAFGAGMPLGAFIASEKMMACLKANPALGHITTFGGHPVSCAAALAGLNVLLKERLLNDIPQKEAIIRKTLESKSHPVRGKGLYLCLNFKTRQKNMSVIQKCLKMGLITDWFLFADNCLRIAPPLNIPNETLEKACLIIKKAMNDKN